MFNLYNKSAKQRVFVKICNIYEFKKTWIFIILCTVWQTDLTFVSEKLMECSVLGPADELITLFIHGREQKLIPE